VAFGAAILLAMYSLFELSYNKFHENVDSIYQVYHTEYTPKGPEAGIANPLPFAAALKEEVPGVEKITRFNGGGVLASIGENQVRLQSAFVDPEFFSIFTFPVLKGNKNPVFDKSEIALTEKAAKTLFGNEEALGKNLDIFIDEQEVTFTVTSIIKNIPIESNIAFDIALILKASPIMLMEEILVGGTILTTKFICNWLKEAPLPNSKNLLGIFQNCIMLIILPMLKGMVLNPAKMASIFSKDFYLLKI